MKANERNGKLHASGPQYVARPDRSFQPFQQLADSSVGTAAEQNGGHRLPLSCTPPAACCRLATAFSWTRTIALSLCYGRRLLAVCRQHGWFARSLQACCGPRQGRRWQAPAAAGNPPCGHGPTRLPAHRRRPRCSQASKFWAASSSEEESEEEVTSSSEEETSSGAVLLQCHPANGGPQPRLRILSIEPAACSLQPPRPPPHPFTFARPPADEGSSDSDSSSSSSSSSGSSRKKGASRFLMGSSDSESEDERRVVRSAKDKAYDELRATCNEIKVRDHRAATRLVCSVGRLGSGAKPCSCQFMQCMLPSMPARHPSQNKMHINDWAAIQTLFDKLNKQLDRTQKASNTQSLVVQHSRWLGSGGCAPSICAPDSDLDSASGRRSLRAWASHVPMCACSASWRTSSTRRWQVSTVGAEAGGSLSDRRHFCLVLAVPYQMHQCTVFLSNTTAEKPKLSPTNTRALTRMKQTLRKHNAAYAEQMRLFR